MDYYIRIPLYNNKRLNMYIYSLYSYKYNISPESYDNNSKVKQFRFIFKMEGI